MADRYMMLDYKVSEMKHRLATCPLLLEAEAMGFEIEIKLPHNCLREITKEE